MAKLEIKLYLGYQVSVNKCLEPLAKKIFNPAVLLNFISSIHDRVPLLHLIDQLRNFLRWILEIIVHSDDIISPGIIESAENSIVLTKIFLKVDNFYVTVFLMNIL